MTERILTDVPESELDEVVHDFKSAGCTAEPEKQEDGNWTVKATCPDV